MRDWNEAWFAIILGTVAGTVAGTLTAVIIWFFTKGS
jgi:ABC-type uncharacterized transport system permease subunit